MGPTPCSPAARATSRTPCAASSSGTPRARARRTRRGTRPTCAGSTSPRRGTRARRPRAGRSCASRSSERGRAPAAALLDELERREGPLRALADLRLRLVAVDRDALDLQVVAVGVVDRLLHLLLAVAARGLELSDQRLGEDVVADLRRVFVLAGAREVVDDLGHLALLALELRRRVGLCGAASAGRQRGGREQGCGREGSHDAESVPRARIPSGRWETAPPPPSRAAATHRRSRSVRTASARACSRRRPPCSPASATRTPARRRSRARPACRRPRSTSTSTTRRTA